MDRSQSLLRSLKSLNINKKKLSKSKGLEDGHVIRIDRLNYIHIIVITYVLHRLGSKSPAGI